MGQKHLASDRITKLCPAMLMDNKACNLPHAFSGSLKTDCRLGGVGENEGPGRSPYSGQPLECCLGQQRQRWLAAVEPAVCIYRGTAQERSDAREKEGLVQRSSVWCCGIGEAGGAGEGAQFGAGAQWQLGRSGREIAESSAGEEGGAESGPERRAESCAES